MVLIKVVLREKALQFIKYDSMGCKYLVPLNISLKINEPDCKRNNIYFVTAEVYLAKCTRTNIQQ